MARKPTDIPAPPPPPAPAAVSTDQKASDDVTSAQSSTSPPTPPAAPPPPPVPPAPIDDGVETTNSGGGPQSTANGELSGNGPAQAEAGVTQGRDKPAGASGRPQEAVRNGVRARDYGSGVPMSDEEDNELPPVAERDKRVAEIERSAWRSGRRGQPLRRHKAYDDSEWAVAQAAHQRGTLQGEADDMSVEDRLARLERAAGLPVPNAVLPHDSDEE